MIRLLAFLLTLSLATPVFAAASPTGRTPRGAWSATQQGIWDALEAANHAWWTDVLSEASSGSSTSVKRFANAVAYQVTGTSSYATAAEGFYDNLYGSSYDASGNATGTHASSVGINLNFLREEFLGTVIAFDYLLPSLSTADRTSWITMLNYWCDLMLDEPSGFSTSASDVDQTVGTTLGCIAWAYASDEYNTRSTELKTTGKIGGVTATGANRSSYRNAVEEYVTIRAVGGAFLEGSMYDMGTGQLLFMGLVLLENLSGNLSGLANIRNFATDYMHYMMFLGTPDRSEGFQWGDVQDEPRTFHAVRRKPLAIILSHVLKDDATRFPCLNQYQNLMGNSNLNARAFVFGNPNGASSDYRNCLSQGWSASGKGLYAFHDDWSNTNGSAFYAHFDDTHPEIPGTTQHSVNYEMTFDLFRSADWAITSKKGYGLYDGPIDQSKSLNTLIMGGLAVMGESRGMLDSQSASTFGYVSGSTSGTKRNDISNANNRYVHEATRSLVYLPSTDASRDELVIIDRLNVDDPLGGGRLLSKYHSEDQPIISNAPYRTQWVFQAPAVPTLGSNTLTWSANAQTTRITQMLPTAANRSTPTSDVPGWCATCFQRPVDSEINGPARYRVRWGEVNNNKWTVGVNVVSVYDDGGTAPNLTLITASDQQSGETCGAGTSEAVGVHVARAGHNDTIVMGNAKQACDTPDSDTDGTVTYASAALTTTVNKNRLRTVSTARFPTTAGYTFPVPAGTTATRKLLVLDLDPTLTWSAAVDGGSATSLGVSSSTPVGQLTISGSGSHTVVITQSGGVDPGDTTAPTVSITSPAASATVSGSVTVTATASDNVGVVGVQFKLDTANLGNEDFSSPYSTTWNTPNSSNGTHDLTAVARDASNNSTTSSIVSVTVSNVVASTLISVISTTGGGTYAVGTLNSSSLLYTDRTYLVNALPAYLTSQEYVRTANNDRTNSDNNYLVLGLTADATLTAVVNAIDPLPGWLNSTWTLRAETVDTTDDAGDPRKIYYKLYDSGTVTLGGKNFPPGSGSESNYIVVATPVFVEITAPTASQEVSGAAVSLTASVGTTTNVQGVTFKVDGVTIGVEDTTAAYGVTLDSTTLGNGAHTVTATIRHTNDVTYVSQPISFTITNTQADVIAPILSLISSGTPTATAATITWETNEASSSQVEYGLDTAYGSTTTLAPALVTIHSVALTSLTSLTTYHYRVLSVDQAGNSATSGDESFTTADGTDPVLTSVLAGATAATTATVTWTTDEAADSDLELRTSEAAIIGTATQTNASDVTSHSLSVTGLTASTTYYGKVRSTDATGNVSDWSAPFSFTPSASPDVTAPVLSAITVLNLSETSVQITWTTDEAATSEVRYGETTDYGSSSTDATLVLSHAVTLSGLSDDTFYHFQVRSADATPNTSAYSEDSTFETEATPAVPTATQTRAVLLYLIKMIGGTVNQ
mgnify:CR=1 FL=1